MTGNGAIVMRLLNGRSDNGHTYAEHPCTNDAKREARRLAELHGGQFVVYVPLVIYEPPPKIVESRPTILDVDRDSDLPF